MRDYSNIVDLANLRGLGGYDRYQVPGPVPVAAGMFGGRGGFRGRAFGQNEGLAAVSTGAAVAGTAVILALNFLFMAYAAKIGARWAGCGR